MPAMRMSAPYWPLAASASSLLTSAAPESGLGTTAMPGKRALNTSHSGLKMAE